jgi:putative NADH-flavin reductase
MMKISIFGASGKTGRPLTEQALAAGHEVVAFVRDASKLPLKHERLTVIQGDATNALDVEQAVREVDAVINTIGHVKGSPKDVQTAATRNIVDAMKKHGVKRIISLTGAGVRVPEDEPKFIDNFIRTLLMLMAKDVLEDGINHAEVLKSSGLEWVIVRGPRLDEGPHTGKYQVGYVGKSSGTIISRADVADFMLKQVTDNTYLRKMPMVSSR